jgi:hypothetical protein
MEKKRKLMETDTRSVNIEDDYALDYWVREFDVSKAKIRAAVLVAGTSAGDVKRELKK